MRRHASVESEMSNKNHCKMRTWGQQTLLSVLASPIPQTEVHCWIVLRLRDRRKNCAVSTTGWELGNGFGHLSSGTWCWSDHVWGVTLGQVRSICRCVPRGLLPLSLSTSTSTSIIGRDTHNTHGSSRETIIYFESRGSMSFVWLVLWFKTWLSEL